MENRATEEEDVECITEEGDEWQLNGKKKGKHGFKRKVSPTGERDTKGIKMDDNRYNVLDNVEERGERSEHTTESVGGGDQGSLMEGGDIENKEDSMDQENLERIPQVDGIVDKVQEEEERNKNDEEDKCRTIGDWSWRWKVRQLPMVPWFQ